MCHGVVGGGICCDVGVDVVTGVALWAIAVMLLLAPGSTPFQATNSRPCDRFSNWELFHSLHEMSLSRFFMQNRYGSHFVAYLL